MRRLEILEDSFGFAAGHREMTAGSSALVAAFHDRGAHDLSHQTLHGLTGSRMGEYRVREWTAVPAQRESPIDLFDVDDATQFGQDGRRYIGPTPEGPVERPLSDRESAPHLPERRLELVRAHPLRENPHEMRQHGDVGLREQALRFRRHLVGEGRFAPSGPLTPLPHHSFPLEHRKVAPYGVVGDTERTREIIDRARAAPKLGYHPSASASEKSSVPTTYGHVRPLSITLNDNHRGVYFQYVKQLLDKGE